MSGDHQALDHLEGRRFGVAAMIGQVRVWRFLSNHSTKSRLSLDGVKDSMAGVSSAHGVRSQFGEDWASLNVVGAIFVLMTVWSEPKERRLFCHKWMKGSRA
jgi:hypothetical protein